MMRKQNGVGMIEIILSLLIFAAGFYTYTKLQTLLLQQSSQNEYLVQAVNYAETEIYEIATYNDLNQFLNPMAPSSHASDPNPNLDISCNGIATTVPAGSTTSPPFTLTCTTIPIALTTPETGATTSNYYNTVSVSVSWIDNNNKATPPSVNLVEGMYYIDPATEGNLIDCMAHNLIGYCT